MFCPVCGNEENEPLIVNGAKVCHKCGCVIERASVSSTDKNKSITTGSVITLILLLVLSVILGILLMQSIGFAIIFALISIFSVVFFSHRKQK